MLNSHIQLALDSRYFTLRMMVLKGVGAFACRKHRAAMGGGGKTDAGGDDGASADFLRRLSVADAKVLLERTRKEKDAKTQEMQKMIGVRYRDLIDSADKIVSMHSAAMRLETSLKEMPDKWKQMEAKLAATLTRSETYVRPASNSHTEASGEDTKELVSAHERVLFVVTAHEKLWFHLDRGESSQALQLYHRAKGYYESPEVQEQMDTYPFLPSMWASVKSFEQRVENVALACLAARGRSTKFYADNLDALSVLRSSTRLEDLLDLFLDSRTKWLELNKIEGIESEGHEDSFTASARQIRLNLRSLLLTVLHANEVFLSGSDSNLLDVHNHQLRNSIAASLLSTIVAWFKAQMKLVSGHASVGISRIATIASITEAQTKLGRIEQQYEAYKETQLWGAVQPHGMASTSMFELLFGNALRKRTRDLVQHSFVDATNAIKTEISACVSAMVESPHPSRGLKCVRFYECFDAIHKKVAGLRSSELQRVLTEEYMRTLLSVVDFVESEFSWLRPAKLVGGQPTYLLGLANILVSIVSNFPSRRSSLFGDESSHRDLDIQQDIELFESAASDGRISREAMQRLFKEPSQATSKMSSFIEEELQAIESFGFYSFHIISRIRASSPYPSIFIGVLRSLAEKYCEAWARRLLQDKIAPVREYLQVEQYDLTNEDWIAMHQGWSEHVIEDEEMSSGDGDDDEPVNVAPTGEKIWLPWSESPTVSSFLFSCCYALDEAYRLVRTSNAVASSHSNSMHELIRSVLTEQLTIMSVDVYEEAVNLVVKVKTNQSRSVLNFGECCMQQFLFDMYFVRATLGFSDFIRFGWGDDIDLETCTPSVARLKKLFDRMHDFIDPVDWEIYGPQLIENVVIQFRKSRLLFSSLSEANDISEINGKPIVVSAQDTRPIIKIAEPVPRFSLLPVPTSRRRSPRSTNGASSSSIHTADSTRAAPGKADSLFHEPSADAASSPSLPSLKLQNLLSGSAGSNILSAAASGTNLLTSAAKGMSFLSSATSSYLRDGVATSTSGSDSTRSRYF